MSFNRKRGRTVVVRNGRLYAVCGVRVRFPAHARLRRTGRHAGLVPGATLMLIALFSAFLLRSPPDAFEDPLHRPPLAAVAQFTIEDFANANR